MKRVARMAEFVMQLAVAGCMISLALVYVLLSKNRRHTVKT